MGDGMTIEVSADEVAAVRAFNRFYTNVIGLVHGMYLDMPYPLTEARLLFELARREVTPEGRPGPPGGRSGPAGRSVGAGREVGRGRLAGEGEPGKESRGRRAG
jgi:hypothetical protein